LAALNHLAAYGGKPGGLLPDEGYRTRDIMSAGMTEVSTEAMGDLIAQRM
jgi:hypothetical protein